MEFKGTRGSWKKIKTTGRKKDTDAFWKSIISENGNTICEVKGIHYGIPNNETISNALLISKAPELLSDLNDIVWLIERGATMEELEERIKTSKQLIKEATEL